MINSPRTSTTVDDMDEPLVHPSFLGDTDEPQSIHISREQMKDISFKVININCQSVVGRKASLLTMGEMTGADIVIGTVHG